MISNFIIVIIGSLFLIHLSLATVHFPIGGNNLDARVADILSASPRLYHLGTVGSKSFFLQNSTAGTWAQHKTNASWDNLMLAEFESSAESDFIKNIATSRLPLNNYYMGGWVSETSIEYKWDVSRGVVGQYSLVFNKPVFHQCVLLSYTGGNRIMSAASCENIRHAILQTPPTAPEA